MPCHIGKIIVPNMSGTNISFRATENQEGPLPESHHHFWYFSLKANTWKEVEGPLFPDGDPPLYYEPILGLFFNGAIHWLAHPEVDVIAVFDLVERTFSEIDLPHDFDPFDCKLRAFGGFLSLCCTGFVNRAIWVMEEYKVQSSWVKRDIVVSDGQLSSKLLDPICCTRSGDPICCIGIDARDGLVKFNDKGEVKEYSDLPKTYDGVVTYTVSLLSLPADSS